MTDPFPLSPGDHLAVTGAYDALTRLGNRTATEHRWDDLVDRAHQQLGLLLARHESRRIAAGLPATSPAGLHIVRCGAFISGCHAVVRWDTAAVAAWLDAKEALPAGAVPVDLGLHLIGLGWQLVRGPHGPTWVCDKHDVRPVHRIEYSKPSVVHRTGEVVWALGEETGQVRTYLVGGDGELSEVPPPGSPASPAPPG